MNNNRYQQTNFSFQTFLCSELISISIYIIISLLTIHLIGPIFIEKNQQPNIKDVTVIIPSGGIDSAINSLRKSGFKKINAISYDKSVSQSNEFNTFKKIHGNFGINIENYVNTSFVLYTGVESFNIPNYLPKLPNKPMVIGYTFEQCHENGYALLLPTKLEYSLITKEAMNRFNDFMTNTLKNQLPCSEGFRVFTEFHSLHLLMMPCEKMKSSLPKWETLEVIEYENNKPNKPWNSIPKIPEVWNVRDLL